MTTIMKTEKFSKSTNKFEVNKYSTELTNAMIPKSCFSNLNVNCQKNWFKFTFKTADWIAVQIF